MRLFQLLFRAFFYLLYHQFAWTYDFVAAAVSLGRWKNWVRGVLSYTEGHRVLELGHGPGHLQQSLNEKGWLAFGLDESRFMGRLARRRLVHNSLPVRLSRGYAQSLPFADQCLDCVLSTFPSEYIFEPRTLTEIRRVLVPGGRFVLLPAAWITGQRPLERLAAWLFRITGQAAKQPGQLPAEARERFTRAGLEVRAETVSQNGSLLLLLLAERPWDPQ
jgi:ubiquinone/menaquinone biosynthesis C-methylase UbiE